MSGGASTKWDFPVIPAYGNLYNAAAGTVTLVPASAGKKVRIFSISISTVAADVATLASNGVNLALNILTAAGGTIILQYNPHGWFEGQTGFSVTLATGIGAFSSVVQYAYIDPLVN